MEFRDLEPPVGDRTGQTGRKKAGFFPADYLVMTVTSLLLLGAASGLGAQLISYWMSGTEGGILADLRILYWIATLAVVTPIHALAYWRIRRTDRSGVSVFSLRVAHALLGLYLLVTVGTVILLSIWLVALWLNAWLGTGSIDKHLYATSLGLMQAIAWFTYATWHFLRVRTDQAKPSYYMVAVGVLALALVVLSVIFPARAYRNETRDFVKQQDLGHIQLAIGEYVDARQDLPGKLTDLEGLNDGVRKRLGDYRFVSHGSAVLGVFGYELCANFATNSGHGEDAGLNFGSHRAGEQCFTRFTISGAKLEQGLENYVKNVENGAAKLSQAIAKYIQGVEGAAFGQIHQLEHYLEGLEHSTGVLQQEMERLEGNLTTLGGDTGQLDQDFDDVGKFFHDLLCGLGLGCDSETPAN